MTFDTQQYNSDGYKTILQNNHQSQWVEKKNINGKKCQKESSFFNLYTTQIIIVLFLWPCVSKFLLQNVLLLLYVLSRQEKQQYFMLLTCRLLKYLWTILVTVTQTHSQLSGFNMPLRHWHRRITSLRGVGFGSFLRFIGIFDFRQAEFLFNLCFFTSFKQQTIKMSGISVVIQPIVTQQGIAHASP